MQTQVEFCLKCQTQLLKRNRRMKVSLRFNFSRCTRNSSRSEMQKLTQKETMRVFIFQCFSISQSHVGVRRCTREWCRSLQIIKRKIRFRNKTLVGERIGLIRCCNHDEIFCLKTALLPIYQSLTVCFFWKEHVLREERPISTGPCGNREQPRKTEMRPLLYREFSAARYVPISVKWGVCLRYRRNSIGHSVRLSPF